MGMNPELKAELQSLAVTENRTLTNFIETELQKIAAPRQQLTRSGPRIAQ